MDWKRIGIGAVLFLIGALITLIVLLCQESKQQKKKVAVLGGILSLVASLIVNISGNFLYDGFNSGPKETQDLTASPSSPPTLSPVLSQEPSPVQSPPETPSPTPSPVPSREPPPTPSPIPPPPEEPSSTPPPTADPDPEPLYGTILSVFYSEECTTLEIDDGGRSLSVDLSLETTAVEVEEDDGVRSGEIWEVKSGQECELYFGPNGDVVKLILFPQKEIWLEGVVRAFKIEDTSHTVTLMLLLSDGTSYIGEADLDIAEFDNTILGKDCKFAVNADGMMDSIVFEGP